jgi:hypothetical protein
MRYREILLEFDLTKTLQSFGTQLVQRFSEHERGSVRDAVSDSKGEINPKAILELLTEIDPTPKNAFVLHLIRWYLNGSIKRFEDAYKAIEPLQLYAKFRNRGLPPLNKMSFDDLLDLGDKLKAARSQTEASRDEEEGFYNRKEASLEMNTPEFKIIRLGSLEAAMFFGRNTRWCTASEKNNMFEEYNEEGPMYVINFKGQGDKKWQFHFQSGQFMNEKDEELTEDAVKGEPEIANHFRKDFAEFGLVEYIIDPDSLSERAKDYAITTHGINIYYFKNPTPDMIRLALKDNRVTFDHLPEGVRDVPEYQILLMQGHGIERYFSIQKPFVETTEFFEKKLRNLIFELTSEEDISKLLRHRMKCAIYAVKHNLASPDKLNYIKSLVAKWIDGRK